MLRVLDRALARKRTRMLLENKNAVVYGGAGSIGRAVAAAFAREGARVVLAGHTLATLDEVAEELSAAGGAVETAQVDALDERAVDAHADAVASKAGGIDVSFNAIGRDDLHGFRLLAPLDGREHQQHSTDPEQQHREATRAVLVGGPAGASIAASRRGVKEESGCHQGNAENLDGATHVSSLQVRVAHDAHLTTVGYPAPTTGRVGRPAQGHHQPDGGIAEQEDQ
jgi:NAD(P)-dependent dehydrogenase (short-subunit alcohol dehydrogenase family)